jgi:hypothetical protein
VDYLGGWGDMAREPDWAGWAWDRDREDTDLGRIFLSLAFFLFRLLRGTRALSFAHSAPMSGGFLCVHSGTRTEGPLRGPFGGVFPRFVPLSYISHRDESCKTRSFIHSFTSYESVSRWLGRGVFVRLAVKANNPDERGPEESIPGG